jgi:outer membrane lipoprotein LolB
MSRAVRLLAAAIALVIAACATLPEETDGLSYSERRERIDELMYWEIRGRIAIDTGENAYQGRFSWWQDGERLTLLIRGPFGAGSVEIAGTAEELLVRTRRESWILRDPEAELSDLLGWWVPVTSLKWWLFGVADANFDDSRSAIANGVLERLEQRDWRLDYDRYQLAAGVLIPRTIDMHHASLRLVVTVDSLSTEASESRRLN